MADQQVEWERQKIDTEIQQLRRRISVLSSKRNSLAPIARLPSEVMTAILLKARHGTDTMSKSRFVFWLSWVCRYWREVSFGSSRLWSYLDLRHAGVVDAFLERSRSAHLEVNLKNLQQEHLVSISRIVGHLPRIASLSLDALDDDIAMPQLAINFAGTTLAPFLKVLSLRGLIVPTEAFSMDVPVLKDLILEGCTFSATPPIFLNVQVLKINFPIFPIDIDHLISLLPQMPQLSWLDLYGALASVGEIAPPGAIINLPNIDIISIQRESSDALAYFLPQVKFRPSADLSFSIVGSSGSQEAMEVLPDAIGNCRDGEWDIAELYISRTRGETTIKMHSDEETESTTSVVLYYPSFFNPNFPTPMVSSMNLATLERLEISESIRDVFQQSWGSVFGELQYLEVIKVWDKAAYGFLGYLVGEGQRVRALELEEAGKGEGDPQASSEPSASAEVTEFESDDGDQLTEEEISKLDHFGFKFWMLRELIIVLNDGDDTVFQPGYIDTAGVGLAFSLRMRYAIGLRRLTYTGWPISEDVLEEIEQVIPVVEVEEV